MSAPRPKPAGRWRRRGAVVALAALLVAAGFIYWKRQSALPTANAQPAPSPGLVHVSTPAAPPVPADYYQRVVAYVFGTEAVTRAELGEYLIPRYGPEKIDLLLKRMMIDRACRVRGIEVTAGEIEAALAEHLRGLNVNREQFVQQVLHSYHKNLYEWKEDVIRPRLQLAKLCGDRVRVSEQELHDAFDARFGEKVQCRVILWPMEKKEEVQARYAQLRDSDEAFETEAHLQVSPELASSSGRLKAFGRHTLVDKVLEDRIFTLQKGQTTELIITDEVFGRPVKPEKIIAMVKCDERLAADTTVSYEARRAELTREVLERKMEAEIPAVMAALVKEANPQNFALQKPAILVDPTVKVLGTLYGSEPLTREMLGEFLILRFGPERLELLVNKRIVDRACQSRGVAVTDADIDADLDAAMAKLKEVLQSGEGEAAAPGKPLTREELVTAFVRKFLNPQGKNLYEWREDWCRPRLQLARLVRGQIVATQEDLKMAFDAYYGERVECRLILWPKGEERFAMSEYAKVRDSEAEFDRKARHQASVALARNAGRLDQPLGRNTTGCKELEDWAFRLQPGEVSGLIATPEGTAIVKVDRRLPPQTSVTLDQVRAKLEQEVIERKTQAQIPVFFAELRKQSNPNLVLKDPTAPEDLKASVERDLASMPPTPGRPGPGAGPTVPASALPTPH